MTTEIVYPDTYDQSKLMFSEPKIIPGGAGAKTIYVNYGGKGNRFIVQTACAMRAPFGLSTFSKQDGGMKYSIPLQVDTNAEPGSEMNLFYEMLESIDKVVLKQGYINRGAWLKQATASEDIVASMYYRNCRYSKDADGNIKSNYMPNMSLACMFNDKTGTFDMRVYNSERVPYANLTPEKLQEVLTRGSAVTAIIECGGVWVAAGKFGLTWRVKQLVINSAGGVRLPEFAFRGVASQPAAEEESEQLDDGAIFNKPSVLSAVLPKPAAAAPFKKVEQVESEDGDEADESDDDAPLQKPEPIPRPPAEAPAAKRPTNRKPVGKAAAKA